MKAAKGPMRSSRPPVFWPVTRALTSAPTSISAAWVSSCAARRESFQRSSSRPLSLNSNVSPILGGASNSASAATPCMRGPSSMNTSAPLIPTTWPRTSSRGAP